MTEKIIIDNNKEYLEITPEPILMKAEKYTREDLLIDIASLQNQIEIKQNQLKLFKEGK